MACFTETSYAVRVSSQNIEMKKTMGSYYLFGTVCTPEGLVAVYAQPNEKGQRGYSNLVFIWKGRRYSRTYQRYFGARGLAILAGRFAWQIAEANPA